MERRQNIVHHRFSGKTGDLRNIKWVLIMLWLIDVYK